MVNCRYNTSFDCEPCYGLLINYAAATNHFGHITIELTDLYGVRCYKKSVSYLLCKLMVFLHRLMALSAASRYLGLWVDSYIGCTFLLVSNKP